MRKKITIVGAGRVGGSLALWCALKELGDIVLWNRTEETAKGIALDISETSPIPDFDVNILGTNDYRKTKNSDIVVVTAGAQRKAGMSREDLIDINGNIVKDIVGSIVKYSNSKKCTLIIVTNPLDAMVYLAKKISGFPKNRVIGMAGILDSSRFRCFIAHELNVSVEDVSATVLGGHGDSMIPLPGHAAIGGVPLTELISKNKIDRIIKRTRNAGAEVIKLEESSAFISTSAAVAEIVEAILRDKKRVLPCSAYLTGEYGVKGIFIGVPVILGSNGVEKVIELKLSKQEKKDFIKSANNIKNLVKKL